MKKLYIILAMLAITGLVQAQDDQDPTKKQQNVEALKVAFISRDLQLTPNEAQTFWPVYNQYSKELRGVITDEQDILDRDEKVLNLRKKYKDQFTKILGGQRMNKLFDSEARFRRVLIKSIRNQRGQRNQQMLKRNQ